jgi:hypothetical protein
LFFAAAKIVTFLLFDYAFLLKEVIVIALVAWCAEIRRLLRLALKLLFAG